MFLQDHLVASVLLAFISPQVQWLKVSVTHLAPHCAVRAWLSVNSLSVPGSVTWTVLMVTRRSYFKVSLHTRSVPPSRYQLEAGVWGQDHGFLPLPCGLMSAWWHCSKTMSQENQMQAFCYSTLAAMTAKGSSVPLVNWMSVKGHGSKAGLLNNNPPQIGALRAVAGRWILWTALRTPGLSAFLLGFNFICVYFLHRSLSSHGLQTGIPHRKTGENFSFNSV